MRMSAPKSKEKRLDRAIQTCADQTVSSADPAAETRNRVRSGRQVPTHWYRERKGLDRYAIGLQYDRDGVLLGECRLKTWLKILVFLVIKLNNCVVL